LIVKLLLFNLFLKRRNEILYQSIELRGWRVLVKVLHVHVLYVVKSETTYCLLVQYHSITTYESVELRVSTTCSMCWNVNPTRRAFFVALLQTFLYTLAAKTMIAIGVDVRVSAVFQADGTYELFV
jgi:hypothetical protein